MLVSNVQQSDLVTHILTQVTHGKESACQCRRCRRYRIDLGVGKILWRRKWQPTPIFLPGKPQVQRSLAGYHPWDHKESNMTEHTHTHTHTHTQTNTYLFLFRFFSHIGCDRLLSRVPFAFVLLCFSQEV